MPIYRLKNKIQHYHWGSYNGISDLFGEEMFSNSLPQAELWMGANSIASSNILTKYGEYSLLEMIKENPIEVLGEESFEKFGDELPYLFKVLAINRPISVQIHPNKEQAMIGYKEENRKQISFDSPKRNYKDCNHKPECIYALTPLWGLSGFRNIREMQLLIDKICPRIISESFEIFKLEPNQFGLRNFFQNLVLLSNKEVEMAISQALSKIKNLKEYSLIFEWVCNLAKIYPDDIAVFAPVVLNLVKLDPGQVLFIPSGIIHSYMSGLGVELAVNSDNVVRGGLSCKYRDINSFFNLADYDFQLPHIVEGKKVRFCEICYETIADEFALSIISVIDNKSYLASRRRNVEILLCTQGYGTIRDMGIEDVMTIEKGNTVLVTASVPQYSISGNITILKASVPIREK